ncbi:MAG: hypothetical protein U0X92_11070 [Anaerolineales bacterium]
MCGKINFAYIFVRRKTLDAFDDLATLHVLHLTQLRLRALRRVSAQVALAAFGAHKFARTRQTKRFDIALWVLSFNLPLAFALRGIRFISFQNFAIKTAGLNFLARGLSHNLWDLPVPPT